MGIAREEYKVVYQRISYYKNNSYDVSFHQYLDNVINEVANSEKSPNEFLAELDANYQKYLQIVARSNKEKKEENNKKLEYNLGVGVLSVFGIAFILYGIFSLGKEYITNTVLMILLFALSAIVVAFGELFLRKKHAEAAKLVTCIGFLLAYFTTYYSHSKTDVLNTIAVAIFVTIISILAELLSHFRKSDSLEIVVGLGVACLAFPFTNGDSTFSFVLFGCLIAAINLGFYIVSGAQTGTIAKVIRTITMVIAGLCMIESTDYADISFWYKGGLCLLFALVYAVAYIITSEDKAVKYTCLASLSLFCLFLAYTKDRTLPVFAAALAGVALISLILFLYNRKSDEKWIGYILFVSFAALKSCTLSNPVIPILIVFGAMLLSKLMLYLESDVLNVYDCVLTGFSLFLVLYYYKNLLVCTIALVAILGCFLAKKYRLYHIVFTCITMVCFSFLNDALWLSVSFMVVALLLILYGCYINKFEVRLSGLILSLIVCLKVALFDFRREDDFRRLIVFIVVGLIAIGISFLYMYLEKRERTETSEKELSVETVTAEEIKEEAEPENKDLSEGDNLDA